jgi:hydroxymethylpyrimidine pyrophosphatase-like HAD family hydrolase
MPYQAIILDMDGTLLNEFNSVGDRLKKYFLELRQMGYLFLLQREEL